MLAIDGQHAHAVFAGLGHHDFSRHDENFLRSHGYIFAGTDCGQSWLETTSANNGDENDVGVRECGQLDQSFRSAEDVGGRAKSVTKFFGFRRVADGNGFRPMFAGLIEEEFGIVSGPEAEQADVVRQVLGDLYSAGADRAGAAKQHDVFHPCVSAFPCVRTCRRYKYMIGALNNRLSSKSRMPPMPGKNRPESFTPASRLNNDSIKSPTTAVELRTTPRITACVR